MEWYGPMVTGPDGRGWTLRESFALDFKISRISHDFGTFKFLLKFLKSFKISKVATKKPVLFFFQGQSLAERWFVGRCFFLWIFPPQQNDGFAPTLAVSSEWLSLHGSVLSGISPGKSFTRGPTGSINVERWPNFFPLPDSTFTKHGLPFHLQRHLCSICINGAFVGSKSVCSLVGTSCGTNIKHRKTRSGGAISEKSCFCRPFGWFWGLETDFKPLKTVACFKSWNLKKHWFIGYVLHNDKDNYSASMILLVFASKQVWILYPTAGCFLQWFFLTLWKRHRHLISLPSEILFQMKRFWELYSNLQALMGRATTRSNQTLKEYPVLLGLVSGATVWTSRALGVDTLKMVSGWVKLTVWIHEKQSF